MGISVGVGWGGVCWAVGISVGVGGDVGISVEVGGSFIFPACIRQEHSCTSFPSLRCCGNQSLISLNVSSSLLQAIIPTVLRHAKTRRGHLHGWLSNPKLMQVNMSQVLTLIKHKQSLYPPQRRCCSSTNSSCSGLSSE